jgi:hypothetical protein
MALADVELEATSTPIGVQGENQVSPGQEERGKERVTGGKAVLPREQAT